MALSLRRCAPPEPLHQLAGIRERSLSAHRIRSSSSTFFSKQSSRSIRALHDSTETSSTQLASTDRMRISSTKPCCKISSLVIAPRKHARRSSRLRVKKSREDVKIESADIEAAEWVSRTLANNGVVEIDPLTITEQIRLAQKTGSTNAPNPVASLTTSSEVPNYFPPTGGLPKVPFGVALAAGSAVVLATAAVLIRSLSTPKAEAGIVANQIDSEENRLRSSLAGEPLKTLNEDPFSDKSSKGSSTPAFMKDKRLPAEVLASAAGLSPGAAILTSYDLQTGTVKTGIARSSMPMPPTLSKAGLKGQMPRGDLQREDSASDSATPFFSPGSSNVTSSTPTSLTAVSSTPASPVSRGLEVKYKQVTPFFPSDRVATSTGYENASSSECVTPFFPDEQGSEHRDGSSLDNVTPFFPDEQGSEHRNGSSLDNVTPFFPDEQGRLSASRSSWETVTPFFPDEQVRKQQNGSSFDTVIPFFPDEQGRDSASVSQLNTSFKYENVTPFFPDDRAERLGPSRAGEQFGRWNGGSSGGLKRKLTKAEEERVNAQYQALQAAFPVVAIGAGALGALAGVDGALEMVGLTATASFISYELLWANKRKELVEELSKITDHKGFLRWLQKRKIVKDEC